MTTLVSPEFVAEAQEIVDALNRDLIAVEDEMRSGSDEIDPDRLNNLFRSAHSLKGIAGMFGLELARHFLPDLDLGRIDLEMHPFDGRLRQRRPRRNGEHGGGVKRMLDGVHAFPPRKPDCFRLWRDHAREI